MDFFIYLCFGPHQIQILVPFLHGILSNHSTRADSQPHSRFYRFCWSTTGFMPWNPNLVGRILGGEVVNKKSTNRPKIYDLLEILCRQKNKFRRKKPRFSSKNLDLVIEVMIFVDDCRLSPSFVVNHLCLSPTHQTRKAYHIWLIVGRALLGWIPELVGSLSLDGCLFVLQWYVWFLQISFIYLTFFSKISLMWRMRIVKRYLM